MHVIMNLSSSVDLFQVSIPYYFILVQPDNTTQQPGQDNRLYKFSFLITVCHRWGWILLNLLVIFHILKMSNLHWKFCLCSTQKTCKSLEWYQNGTRPCVTPSHHKSSKNKKNCTFVPQRYVPSTFYTSPRRYCIFEGFHFVPVGSPSLRLTCTL